MISILTLTILCFFNSAQAMLTPGNLHQDLTIRIPKQVESNTGSPASSKLSATAPEWKPANQAKTPKKTRHFYGDFDIALPLQIQVTQRWIDQEEVIYKQREKVWQDSGRASQSAVEAVIDSFDYLNDLYGALGRLKRIQSENNSTLKTSSCLENQENENQLAQTIIPFSNKLDSLAIISMKATLDLKKEKKLAKKARLVKEKEERTNQQKLIPQQCVETKTHTTKNDIKFIRGMINDIIDNSVVESDKKRQRQLALAAKSLISGKSKTQKTPGNFTGQDLETLLIEQEAWNASQHNSSKAAVVDRTEKYSELFNQIRHQHSWSGMTSQLFLLNLNMLQSEFRTTPAQFQNMLRQNKNLNNQYRLATKQVEEIVESFNQGACNDIEYFVARMNGKKTFHDLLQEGLQHLTAKK